ncbi:Alpha/Beta hydrolase protein [Lentinula raphanica]|uniref:Alpha/Beta hydrolase protein n=1 Tax=Lentinula raphanica TaxID=153919 RepID=A0AA38UC24_9AGAR|nr:Alpha/Beta hydrolase protein [Lentinula raphanica]KAJ3836130.1 Alpha/Beta hydrolase protein [Lentinula raphanica]KAJ3971554.1 Alpha/Beta hydrolase protein [Lentinula raphanica]
MPHVQVTSSTGKINFKYTICTPACEEASEIDKSLPTLLFIHPISIAEHIYHAQFCDPRLRRFNLVSFDMRGGHGGTTGDKVPAHYGQVEAAEDTMLLMDALHLPPCHIVGMSSGTTIALQVAVMEPKRVLSLFLISHLCLEIPPEVAEGHQEVWELWRTAFPDESTMIVDIVYDAGFGNSQYMFTNPKVSPLVTAMMTITYPVAMASWNYHNLDQFRIMNLDFYLRRKSHPKSALSRIKGPVKIVHGSTDVAYPKSYSEKFLNRLTEAGVDASLLEIPGAPHYLAPDYANVLNPALHEFILKSSDSGLSCRAPIPKHVVSPWEDAMAQASRADHNSSDTDNSDDFIISTPIPD